MDYQPNPEDLDRLTGEVTEEDLEALQEEINLLDGGDEVKMAERLFKENLPGAVLNIVKMANHAQSDRVRFDASKYIVERNMGRLQDAQPNVSQPLEKLLQEVFGRENGE